MHATSILKQKKNNIYCLSRRKVIMNFNKIIISVLVILVVVLFCYIENNWISISNINYNSNKIPKSFQGYKIVHLSDLHNKSFGKNQKKLIDTIKKTKPDLIVFTGDIIDSRRYDEKPSLELMKNITEIAPVYYVTGNHEIRTGKAKELEDKLQELGVRVLENKGERITKGSDSVFIYGIDDPSGYDYNGISSSVKKELMELDKNNKGFNMLLAHRPEHIDAYSSFNFDLVFSGHAHGGQVRIPFIGGVIAPGQGFFPKYTSGAYKYGSTTMIVSRGLGNSLAPVRVFNRPEVVVVTLSNN